MSEHVAVYGSHAQAQPGRAVEGLINYIGAMTARPRYYANDHSRDVLVLDPHRVLIDDARARSEAPCLSREGFQLFPHSSAVANFKDAAQVAAIYPTEIEQLLLDVSDADRVVISGPGILRFGERSEDAGKFNNSMPARFIHVDVSDATARQFAARSAPKDTSRPIRRFAHYNMWRALSPPPQDIPLAVCDARSLASPDLVEADAIFDVAGSPEWSFVSWVVRYNRAHCWSYFSAMNRHEALVFKTNDSDTREPHCVAHSAFDDPTCPTDVPPRASIEMRGTAYWFG